MNIFLDIKMTYFGPSLNYSKILSMKKIYFLFSLLITTVGFSQVNYPGNTKTGFGGPVGTGSLTVSDNGETVTFKLNKGTNPLNDAVVIYIDSKTGGFNTTSGFLDIADGLRKAISGFNGGTERSTLTFPASFAADYAVAFDAGFGGVWALQGGSTEHTYLTSANLPAGTTVNSTTFTLTVNKATIGLTSGFIGFKFFATYIAPSAYRSDEAIGDPMTGFIQGYNSQTLVAFNTYTSSILPVKLVGFKAVKDKNVVQLNWTVAQESNIESYQVQRSKDGINFTTIQTIGARNQSGYQPNYTSTDASPLKGVNYYRLAINENGRKEMSGIATVTMSNVGNNFTINYTPNSTRLNIRLIGLDAGSYSVLVVNAVGQLLQSLRLAHDGSEANKEINLKGGLSKGIYRVVLLHDNNRSSQAFMVP